MCATCGCTADADVEAEEAKKAGRAPAETAEHDQNPGDYEDHDKTAADSFPASDPPSH